MCLILFSWQPGAKTPLLFAANRDEYHGRPAQTARFWPDHPALLAGRDLQAGGTWLGLTRGGRFAAVTNFREPGLTTGERSRGNLCTNFLLGEQGAAAFCDGLASTAASYGGFNLLLWDGGELHYYSNQDQRSQALAPGIYGISNGYLDDPWPKVISGKQALAAARSATNPMAACLDLLGDRSQPGDGHLPDTGVGMELERFLAPRFIVSEDYGTRVSTVVAIEPGRRAQLVETSFRPDGNSCGQIAFDVALGANP